MEYIYICIVLVFVYYVVVINNIKSSKLIKDTIVEEQIQNVNTFLKKVEENKKEYFTYSQMNNLLKEYEDVYNLFKGKSYRKIKNESILKFIYTFSNLSQLVKNWNEEYIANELLNNGYLLDNIDGKSLDEQQRRAVVVDEDNNLVLAGAGSGKTLTISGKVKYLVNAKNVKPEEILLISFTRKAADEMNERISKKLGFNLESKTFHKLGLDIIKEKRKKSPDISDNLDNIVDKYFKESIYKDKSNFKNLITFYSCYINIPKEIDKFDNLGEYYKHCKSLDLTTIKSKYEMNKINKEEEKKLKLDKKTINGEQVKSIEEVIIANYLYLNGVKYIYEYKYPYDLESNYRKNYRPDFYLPDYDIYIEHFGINKDYKSPWLSEIEEKKYIEGIYWKRDLHKQHKTTLVETYSYYNTEGILLSELEKKLTKLGVKFKEVDCEDIYNTIIDNKEDRYFNEFRKLIATFIKLFKSRGYTLNNFDNILKTVNGMNNRFLMERNLLFIEIVKPIYIEYQEFLKLNSEIDFDDMIIEATEIVKNKEVHFNYKYIIIDEYQDISKSRFDLIKEIKNQTNAKLMCVGDDWQSIYRFTGSDIDLFTNFDKYVGYYELLKIEKTYRNSQQLIDIAGKFVMKNKNQLAKSLKSDKNNKAPIKMISYNNDICGAIESAIEDIVKIWGRASEITILGRNNFDIKVLDTNIKYKVIKDGNDILIKHKEYPNLKINYLTAHKSKGLEGDNVIIINLENKITGFPNQMADDPVLDLVLTKDDSFEFAEERRLFYVALTRTRNTAYLIVPEKNSSIFCDELKKNFDIKNEVSTNEKTIESPRCPKCIQGRLIKRIDMYKNEFVGCDNYPMCDFTYKSVEIFNRQVICNKCNSYMVKRKYKGDYFLACINFPYCRNTKEYNESREIKVEEETTFVQNEEPKYMYINKLIEKYGEEEAINVAKEELIRLQTKGVGTSSKAKELKTFISMKESSCKKDLYKLNDREKCREEQTNRYKRLYEDNVNYVEFKENKFKYKYEDYYDEVFHNLTKIYPDQDEFL